MVYNDRNADNQGVEMAGKWVLLSFLLLTLSAQAETQRDEPSVLFGSEMTFIPVAQNTDVQSGTTDDNENKTAASLKEKTKAMVENLKNAKEKILSKAKELLGTPYGFGNKTGERTDCSGFTQQVFRQFGVSLPRSAAEQALLGENVNLEDLQVGDLLFYRTYKSDPSHVAIYAGDGQIIHASYSAKKVQYDSIDKDYYKQRFLYAKRLPFQEVNNYSN